MWAQVRYLAAFLASYERGSSAYFSQWFFLPSSLHLCHHLQSIGKVIIFPFLKVVFETIYLKLGLKPTCQGLCAVLSLSHIRLGLEPGQNLWCLVLGPNNARVLDVSLQNNSVRDTVIGTRWICSDLERSTLQECGPLNVVWLVFPSSVISYANEWEDHSNNWGTTHCWVF